MRLRVVGPVAAIAIVLTSLSGSARAGTLYSTGFEAPDFTAGQLIDGQGGWVSRFGNDTGFVTTNLPAAGSQALQIDGGDMVSDGSGLQFGYYRPDLSVFSLDPAVTPRVLFQADVRLDGALTPPAMVGDLVSANFYAINGSGTQISELYVSSDGDIWADNSDGLYLANHPGTTTGQYYKLSMYLDFTTLTVDYSIDGAHFTTLSMPSGSTSDPTVRFIVGLVAVDDFGSFHGSDYTGHFDNILVQSVPEPSTLALAGAGAIGLLGLSLLRRRASA